MHSLRRRDGAFYTEFFGFFVGGHDCTIVVFNGIGSIYFLR
ncbi:hypothetical protein yberc0001_29320 [Yersinia bercovieri ATCC 43970]|uniref:Uncharacterized protein n=1 Tax=Yersinia bercovieri ATCC 43970 TaxID=349968 RepID=A0ABM9Y0L1_YERBE|nr:hypothetical protein yberc0001_29320 [Yersinia bercovieri ATCC 43970]